MPTSHPSQINEILSLIDLANPASVLDIGVGFGRYGFLCRELLDIYKGQRYRKEDWKVRIDGIEAFPEYLTLVHHHVYDRILTGNALDIVDTLDTRYDLTIMIDVLEHFSREDGLTLLRQLLKRSRNILLSTPLTVYEQDAVFDNQFEQHVHEWKREDFAELPGVFFPANNVSLLVFAGESAPTVQSAYRSRYLKKTLVELFPFLSKLRPAHATLRRVGDGHASTPS
ncbi:class I SAM-dependent methyltransferase [Kamptonema cortianum]|nr:class I SAM-dependent methyltransferase [Oscillatoria laete-virens]MDK3155404.1 class I SAM-dependent methyltransferase [Kamptonema cortianum]MDL5046151.1 class I SAM-dependent methyltransferase [Oscillatoria amoena NRMC-F 0135]MDL5052849.1 class I SAM-dependent methyltransferase [Oscillatoria laete-virens NRMC-F 0139]